MYAFGEMMALSREFFCNLCGFNLKPALLKKVTHTLTSLPIPTDVLRTLVKLYSFRSMSFMIGLRSIIWSKICKGMKHNYLVQGKLPY